MSTQNSVSQVFAPDLLAGRVALVTGGGTGLGKATALELARCGAAVMIAGRRAEALEAAVADGADGAGSGGGASGETATGDAATGGSVAGAIDWATVDVRERDDAERLVRTVLERHGRLDVLVNNAGGQYFTPAELIADKGWRAVWRLNVEGMLNVAEAAFEVAFASAGSGVIVNTTLSPHHGMPGMAHSGSARAAVEALTRELAERWRDQGIVVSAVAPGTMATEILSKYPDAVRAATARTMPLARLGAPEEHAWLVTLLASPLGVVFSGSTVTLDGARDNFPGLWPPAGLTDEAGEVPKEERRAGPA